MTLVGAGAIGSLSCANGSVDPGGPGESGQGGGAVNPPVRNPMIPASTDGGVARTICGADGGAMASNVPPIPPGARGGFLPQLPATVKQQATPVPPLTGGTLLALSDGQTAVAADPERDQVYVVDLTANAVRATLALQPGDEPGRLVEDASGLVHVALRKGGAIASLDPKNGTLGARRAVCSAPRGIAFEPASGLLHVACAGGELVSLPAAGGEATRILTLERDLRDVVMGSDGKILVSTFRGAKVLVVMKDGVMGPEMHPGSGLVPSVMGMPRHVSPAVAWRMQPRGDGTGNVVMLHQTGVDDVIDPAAGGYGGLKGCGGIATPGVSVLTPGSPSPPVAGGMQMVSLAVDIAVSPGGSQVAIAVPGNAHTPGLASIFEGPISTVTNGAGGGCAGIGQPQGAKPPMGEVIAVAYTKNSLLLGQTREPAALWRGDTGVTIPLATGSREDTGQLLFHVNAGGGVACASCHPEGGEDGRVWNFACIGGRRTQSIRGGISPTAPFHWDGAEKDFSHLMDDVFVARMSGPPLSGDQKQALQSWVDTIPALPVATGLDATAVAHGKTLFEDTKVACATCHAGALLTNNTTVDVGTGGMLQVPSLRGVSWRAPFMHNGCAATLADRFGTCGGSQHGDTSNLSTADVGDLVTYLQSL
ncbi:MAG TPA: cytochrome-c peroxidase [Polyangia bacterium]|nr:cytochrome-c peroxidase [Polyangia bacterium]